MFKGVKTAPFSLSSWALTIIQSNFSFRDEKYVEDRILSFDSNKINIYYVQRLIWLFWLRWSSLKTILSSFSWPCSFFSYKFGIQKLYIIEIQLIYTDDAKEMWNSLIRNMQFSIKSVWTSMKPDDTNYLLQLIICANTAELQLIDTFDGIFSENLISVTT